MCKPANLLPWAQVVDKCLFLAIYEVEAPQVLGFLTRVEGNGWNKLEASFQSENVAFQSFWACTRLLWT